MLTRSSAEADGDQPTPRAITEHLATLKKKVGESPAKANSPPKPVISPTKPASALKGHTKRGPYGEPETFRKRSRYQKDDSDVDMDMSDFGGLSAADIIKREFTGRDRSVKSKIKNYAQLAGLETDDEAAADTGSDFAQADGGDGAD
jgi:hypothetical protein